MGRAVILYGKQPEYSQITKESGLLKPMEIQEKNFSRKAALLLIFPDSNQPPVAWMILCARCKIVPAKSCMALGQSAVLTDVHFKANGMGLAPTSDSSVLTLYDTRRKGIM